jgi:hypothetical protein
MFDAFKAATVYGAGSELARVADSIATVAPTAVYGAGPELARVTNSVATVAPTAVSAAGELSLVAIADAITTDGAVNLTRLTGVTYAVSAGDFP